MNPQPASAGGSHLWQLAFISFAVALILFEILRGWNRGIARQLARLGALIAASFTAYCVIFFGGALVGRFTHQFLDVPDQIAAILIGGALWLVVYAIINGLGTVLFKRTKQYESATARILCGVGGAVLGLFFGAFIVWVVVVGVRSLGAIADANVRQTASNATPGAEPRTLHAVDVRRRLAGETDQPSPSVMTSLARLRNSLELGSVGDLVKKTDVVLPEQMYETLGKIGQMVSNADSTERFLSFPGVQQLSNHPRIVALRQDPEVARLIQEGRYVELLQNQRVIDALNDPTLTEQIKAFDLRRALDFATQGQQTAR
jgi:hypothetical protein